MLSHCSCFLFTALHQLISWWEVRNSFHLINCLIKILFVLQSQDFLQCALVAWFVSGEDYTIFVVHCSTQLLDLFSMSMCSSVFFLHDWSLSVICSKRRQSDWQIGSGDSRPPSFSTFDGFVYQQFFHSHNTRDQSCAANALSWLKSWRGGGGRLLYPLHNF